MVVILMKHDANPSLANKDNQTPLEIAESKNRVDITEVLKKNSPLLQNSDESLAQGSPKNRIEDIEDVKDIEIPEQTSPTDPYSRYKNPEKVLKKLGRSSFEELPEHLNYQVFQKLQEQEKFKPKVQEVKSKRLTPAERKKKKWVITTAGEEQKKMQEMRAKTNKDEEIDAESLLEEAEQAALKEQEENRLKNQKKNKKSSSSTATTNNKNQKPMPKEEEPKAKEEPPKKPEPKEEEKPKEKPKKTETPKAAPPPSSDTTKKPQPINRGKKIKKNLKRIQSSSSDDENSNNDDDDDEIIVMPSFQNKQQQKSQPQPKESTPQQQQTQPSTNSPQPPPQSTLQPNTQQSTTPQQDQSSISLDQLKKLMDGYLSERQNQQQQQPPQPPLQYAYPPGAYVMPAPGMIPQLAMPTVPPMHPYNPMQAYMGVGTIPMNMKLGGVPQMNQIQQPSGMNVTKSEMQKLEARVSSLEQMIAPAMRQYQMSTGSAVHLGTCQNCKTLNATSVCPRCGIQLCNGCRDIHNNQKCK